MSAAELGQEPLEERVEKWRQEVKEGWTLLVPAGCARARYRHTCGHEQAFAVSQMRRKRVRCGACESPEAVWSREVKEGWVFVSRAESHRAMYRHACGHEQSCWVVQMRQGRVRCGGCEAPAVVWAREARGGWCLLEKVDGARGRYRHSCGHEQLIAASSMRDRVVRCHGCGDTIRASGEPA